MPGLPPSPTPALPPVRRARHATRARPEPSEPAGLHRPLEPSETFEPSARAPHPGRRARRSRRPLSTPPAPHGRTPRPDHRAPGAGAVPREGSPAASRHTTDRVTEVIRWGAFSSALVLVVLLVCGSPVAGALGTSIGLLTVTAVCRGLLRQSERSSARLAAAEQPGPHRGRHSRTGAGAHRGARHQGPA